MTTCASFSRREARAEGENGVVRSDANGDNIVFQREREKKREIEREKKEREEIVKSYAREKGKREYPFSRNKQKVDGFS